MTTIQAGKNKLYSKKTRLGFQKGSRELQCANSPKLILLLKQAVPTDDWVNVNTALSAGCQ